MKKYLIVLAAAVVALAGCKPSEKEGSKYTSLKFKEASIEMAIGDTKKLNVLYEPTTLEAPVCEWSSSDSTVVSVDQNGNIAALASGEANISAKNGDLEAVCHVYVKGIQDMIEWSGWTIWNWDEDTPLCDTVEIEIKIGKVKVVAYPAFGYVWDQDIYPVYNAQQQMTGLEGAGFCLEFVDMPLYIITEGDYKGYYVSNSDLTIVPAEEFNMNDTAYAYCVAAGKRGSAEKFYQYLTEEETTVEYNECFTGTELSYIDWDAEKGYYWFGLAGTGIFVGDESELYYRASVEWFDNQTGLEFAEDGETLLAPGTWCESKVYNYEKLPEQNAAKKMRPMKPVRLAKPFIQKKAATKETMNVLFHK